MKLELKNRVLFNEIKSYNNEPIKIVKGECGGYSIDIDDDYFSSFLYKTERDRDTDFEKLSTYLETYNIKTLCTQI